MGTFKDYAKKERLLEIVTAIRDKDKKEEMKKKEEKETPVDKYTRLQKESGFEVGDTVKVICSAEDGQFGWANTWAKEVMSATVGKEYIIGYDHGRAGLYLQDTQCSYPFFVLELVKKGSHTATEPTVSDSKPFHLEYALPETKEPERDFSDFEELLKGIKSTV